MKCIKCGFESNDSFCPMCGTKLSANNEQQIGVISSDDGPTAYYNEVNPYQQAQPSAPPPQQSMPTPQPYTPNPQQAQQSKQSGNTLPIILSTIVCTVIVLGTVINVVSSISYKNSIMDIFEDAYDYDDYYYDSPYYADYLADEDTTVHPINEVSEFKYGKVKLTNIEVTKDKFEFDDSICECAFTFEIENTSEEALELATPSVQVCAKGDDYYEECYEWLYDDYEISDSYYSDFIIEAGETKKFITYYKVPTDESDFSLMFNLYDYDSTLDFVCYFEASLPQAETTAPATEPTTKKAN